MYLAVALLLYYVLCTCLVGLSCAVRWISVGLEGGEGGGIHAEAPKYKQGLVGGNVPAVATNSSVTIETAVR